MGFRRQTVCALASNLPVAVPRVWQSNCLSHGTPAGTSNAGAGATLWEAFPPKLPRCLLGAAPLDCARITGERGVNQNQPKDQMIIVTGDSVGIKTPRHRGAPRRGGSKATVCRCRIKMLGYVHGQRQAARQVAPRLRSQFAFKMFCCSHSEHSECI